MYLAKVTGNVVSTVKNKHLVGFKLLLVKPIDLQGNVKDENEIICIDLVDAGIGDNVIVVDEGDAVQQILGHDKATVNVMIIGVVDNIEIQDIIKE